VRMFSSGLIQLEQVRYIVNMGFLKINFIACFNHDVCDDGKQQ